MRPAVSLRAGLSWPLVAALLTSPACRDRTPSEPAHTDSPAAPSPGPTPPAPAPPAPAPPAPTPPAPTSARAGIWVGRTELLQQPESGRAWSNVFAAAHRACGRPNLGNQDDPANVCVLAKAIVSARTGDAALRLEVLQALRAIVDGPRYGGRALALGRELAAYVIAADLVDLPNQDAALDSSFRSTIASLLTAPTTDGPANLVECHERRPNNWGTHCGASRAAVAAYLNDRSQLDRVARVFKGWLGDRGSYADFTFGSDLSWQCDPTLPVGVNPRGCAKDGHLLDGVLPDDERRAGGFRWPPPKENYVYEALQGALVQAVILQRAGYDAFQWQDRALLRAFEWLYDQAGYPAVGDDTWQVSVVNAYYGTSFAATVPSTPGKNMGWTDFTHAR